MQVLLDMTAIVGVAIASVQLSFLLSRGLLSLLLKSVERMRATQGAVKVP